MQHTKDRKALAVELFEITGEAVPETDPIVTGALSSHISLARPVALLNKESITLVFWFLGRFGTQESSRPKILWMRRKRRRLFRPTHRRVSRHFRERRRLC
jgi:hypothetical protein